MDLGESLSTALGSLMNNKMRAMLTMLGVIIGVGAVIALLALGTGVEDSITGEIQSLCMLIKAQPKISQSCGRMAQPLFAAAQTLSGQAKYLTDAALQPLEQIGHVSFEGLFVLSHQFSSRRGCRCAYVCYQIGHGGVYLMAYRRNNLDL